MHVAERARSTRGHAALTPRGDALPPWQVAKAMAQERAAFERTRQALLQQAEAAESALLALLRNPQAAWGDAALWQLCMCEYALENMHDDRATGRQFRALCEEVRHASTVPRLRGSMQMDELRAAFARSSLLRVELHRQLEAFKGQYCSLFSGHTTSGAACLSECTRPHLNPHVTADSA